ncbi:MAG: hypothetical protein HY867_09095 [Chloroflexi bacterium]|nr:hypothetical protein [Chloroflexota bacterium]
MTVRIGDMTFADWVSLEYENGWTDTFIFRISARACLPPFDYAPLLKRIVAHTRRKRASASIWVQVDSPGEWFAKEVFRSLKGLRLPYAVTRSDQKPDFLDFSLRPWMAHASSRHPPIVEEKPHPVSHEALSCLRALGRMTKGDEQEVASLAGIPFDVAKSLLHELEAKKLAVYKHGQKDRGDQSKPAHMDLFPSWHLTRKGVSLALRSWGAPRNTAFDSRLEENLYQIGSEHRHIARIWPAWLKSAWPQAEIWTGWSEVGIPGLSVIPDGLAWGRIQGYETLFWLEVGDEHKTKEQILEVTRTRLRQAIQLSERTGVRLVFSLLSSPWVHEAARWACTNLPDDVAVVMGERRWFGELPVMEWGRVTE